MGVNDTGYSDVAISDDNLNQTVLFRRSSLPTENFPVGALLLLTTTNEIYENTGTYAVPVWTSHIPSVPADSEFAPTTKDDGVTPISVSNTEFVSPTNAYSTASSFVSNPEDFSSNTRWFLRNAATISGGTFNSNNYDFGHLPCGTTRISNLGSGNFTIDFDLYVVSYRGTNNDPGVFAVADHDDTRQYSVIGKSIGVHLHQITAKASIRCKINSATYTISAYTANALSASTWYYCRLKRVGNDVTFEVYTNAARTTLYTSTSMNIGTAMDSFDRIALAFGENNYITTDETSIKIDNISGVTFTSAIITSIKDNKNNPTANSHVTASVVNPFFDLDMNTTQELLGLAIHLRSETTVTKFKIQVSDDNASMITRKTVPTALLTVGQWNIILFPRPPKLCRYIRVTGLDSTSKVFGINEVAVLILSESVINRRHSHIAYDPNSECKTLTGA